VTSYTRIAAWTWGYALEIGISGILTALVIMVFMVLLMRLLQFLAPKIEKNEAAIVIEPTKQQKVDEGLNGGIGEHRVIAAITAAVTSYMKEISPTYRTGRITVTRDTAQNFRESAWKVAGKRNLLDNKKELVRIRRNKKRENI